MKPRSHQKQSVNSFLRHPVEYNFIFFILKLIQDWWNESEHKLLRIQMYLSFVSYSLILNLEMYQKLEFLKLQFDFNKSSYSFNPMLFDAVY